MGCASLDNINSATLDRIITWKFFNDETVEMPAPKSTLGMSVRERACINIVHNRWTTDELARPLLCETQEAEQDSSRRKN